MTFKYYKDFMILFCVLYFALHLLLQSFSYFDTRGPLQVLARIFFFIDKDF